MSNINLATGQLGATGRPEIWSTAERIKNLARDLANGSSLDMRWDSNFFYKKDLTTGEDVLYPDFSMMREVTRSGVGYSPNWDFRSGSEVGRLVEYAADAVRWNQPPGKPGSALIEAATTNLITNPRAEGVSSSLPTNWTEWNQAGVTLSGQTYGVENGWPYYECTFSGAPTASQVYDLRTGVNSAAVVNDPATHSVGLRVVAGSLAGVTSVSTALSWQNSTPASISDVYQAVSIDGTHRRFFKTSTGPASTAWVRPFVRFVFTGAAVSFTLRVYAPQNEKNASPTSPILPPADAPGASTRGPETITAGLTSTRSGRANYIDWDFTSGGIVRGMTEFQSNCPRVGRRGLLVEEGTTNQIRNARGEGGTGSTEPTNWSLTGTWDSIATWSEGTENGWPYAQVVLSGTPSGTGVISFEPNTQIVAADGETWCTAVGIARVAGDFTNIDSLVLRQRIADSGGGYEAAIDTADLQSNIDSSHRRFFSAGTISDPDTAYIGPQILAAYTSGAIDITLRFYAPQCEQKAYPTSPMLPAVGAPAASTRAPDVVKITAGEWFDIPGSLFVEFVNNGVKEGATGPAYLSCTSNVNDSLAIRDYSTTGDVVVRDGGTVVVDTALLWTPTVGAVRRVAVALKDNDVAASATSATQALDTSCTMPAVGDIDFLYLGQRGGIGAPWNGFIVSARYAAPDRWTNAELENAVGN